MPESADHTIYIRERPSTLEEDEWAIDWIRSINKREREPKHGCLLVFIAMLVCVVVSPASNVAVALISFAGCLFAIVAYVVIGTWRAGRLASHLAVNSEPIGRVLTLSLPVIEAWEFNSRHDNTSDFVVRFARHLFVSGFVNIGRKPTAFRSGVLPGHRLELDYFQYVPKLISSTGHPAAVLMVIRAVGEGAAIAGTIADSELPSSVYLADGVPFGQHEYFDEFGSTPVLLRDLTDTILGGSLSVVDERVSPTPTA